MPDGDIRRTLALLTRGPFLMTAAFGNKRAGALVRWVQPCADEPPLVCVALRLGHGIKTLIRDARCFALSAIEEDGAVARKFSMPIPPEHADTLDWLDTERLVTGAPTLKRSEPVLDCELVRHMDLEADHSLYIGRVMGARCGIGMAV